MASNTCVVKVGYVMSVEVGTSIEMPTNYVCPTALFCARYESLEVEGEFLPTNMLYAIIFTKISMTVICTFQRQKLFWLSLAIFYNIKCFLNLSLLFFFNLITLFKFTRWLQWKLTHCFEIFYCRNFWSPEVRVPAGNINIADSKTVKQEVNGTVILPPLVFPGTWFFPVDPFRGESIFEQNFEIVDVDRVFDVFIVIVVVAVARVDVFVLRFVGVDSSQIWKKW